MSIDEEYLETFAREQQATAARNKQRCTLCGHEWHGLSCASKVAAAHHGSTPCACPGGAA